MCRHQDDGYIASTDAGLLQRSVDVLTDLFDRVGLKTTQMHPQVEEGKQSVRRLALIQLNGHCRPCRRTGNKRAQVLRDHNIVSLALYRVAFPKCSAAQINAFLYRINYGDVTFRFYTSPQITKAKTRIGLTRKCGSTTAYQAYLPIKYGRGG
ncbi:hypothetical protein QTG54_015780 [Skeletonema marinoi]|uniref:Uncharacterized protein n=1 Tax=Skeletonema marinoi TaxID=267567 RepID=A0AAD8XU19_9STRA|nr:hypothetical protein QTG54_015780 [Skeletonema marinoi]